MLKITWDHLISIMGISLLIGHLYIETGTRCQRWPHRSGYWAITGSVHDYIVLKRTLLDRPILHLISQRKWWPGAHIRPMHKLRNAFDTLESEKLDKKITQLVTAILKNTSKWHNCMILNKYRIIFMRLIPVMYVDHTKLIAIKRALFLHHVPTNWHTVMLNLPMRDCICKAKSICI